MFATILKEVTGYFDKRALLSTFLPTLVAAAGVLFAFSGRGLQSAAKQWNSQILLIAVFVVAVAFWSFVLANVRPTLDQLLQGRWSDSGPIGVLARRCAGRHRRARTALVQTDDRLEELEAAFVQAAEALPRKNKQEKPFAGEADVEIKNVSEALAEAARMPVEKAAGVLPGICARVAALAAPLAAPGTPPTRTRRFAELAAAAERLLEQRLQDVRASRGVVQQRLFLLYPDEPVDVVPTRIGNIMAAAEQHPRIRYGLDPVVIWSRLQPLLPEAFAEALKDAKASVDLMLTLAAYLLLAGLPITVFAAAHASLDQGRPLAFAALAGALIGTAMLYRAHRTVGLVGGIILLAVPVTLFSATPTGLGAVGLRVGVAASIGAGIIALSYGAYACACEASLSYAEQLRSAFDLHRRLVIEAMGLEAPDSLSSERELWLDIGVFLYRGDPPVSPAYRYRTEPSAP